MNKKELDKAFDVTPQLFSDRVDKTLSSLESDKPVRKLTFRMAALAAAALLLVCGVAYAIVYMQGQGWYYDNRLTYYREYEPEKYKAIIDNIETEIPQTLNQDERKLLEVCVQDYAWAQEEGVFTLSFAARTVQSDKYELLSVYQMDVDGACVSDNTEDEQPYSDDAESSSVHWFWTEKGHGPAQSVMQNPEKQLLVVDFSNYSVFIGDSDVQMPMKSCDVFTGNDGASVCVMEDDLNWLGRTRQVNDAISGAIDEEGLLTLRLDYQVYPFEDNELGEPSRGSVAFKVNMK